jgi:hypothetical protein
MQFVQFGMLGALAALAIPILIHLMFRRQARTVELGTLQFLKVVLRDNSKKRRLKRYLLLALRLGSVALIAFLFARPFLLAEEPKGNDHLVVVLVDRSASMGLSGGTRPIDQASVKAREIFRKIGPDTRFEIALFDRVITPFDRFDDAEKSIARPSAAGTDDDVALAWASDLFVRSNARSKTLHILTDLQRSGLGLGEAPRLPGDVKVDLVDLGRPFPKNLGVTALAALPPNPRPREPVIVTAKVRNTSPLPVEKVTVRLHLEATGSTPIDLDRTIDLDGDTSKLVEFSLPGLDEGIRSGFVEVKMSDDLPFDDRRFLAFAVTAPARVLLVDGDPGRSPLESATYFLKAALRLAPDGETYDKSPFDPRSIDLFETRSGFPSLTRTAAVVLANVGDLPADEAKILAKYVENGGGLVVFTGDNVTADGSATLIEAGLGVGKIVGIETSTERPWRLDRWDATHPLLQPFADPEHGELRRPTFWTITRITPDPTSRVLARFRDDQPALLERSVGRGKVVWFASSGDRSWGDWPRGRMFLPMVHQMVAYSAGLAEGGPIRPELAVEDRLPGVVESEGILRIINADPAESETSRCSSKEFADRYGFRLPDSKAILDDSNGSRKPADDRLRSDEVWPWIALTLIGLLLLEQFLANRTAA